MLQCGRVLEVGSGVSKRIVIQDKGRRYRVTESMAAMYLMAFGAVRRPARTGEAFEISVLDYVRVALVPASIVAEWSRSPNEAYRLMSEPSPAVPRCGLFSP